MSNITTSKHVFRDGGADINCLVIKNEDLNAVILNFTGNNIPEPESIRAWAGGLWDQYCEGCKYVAIKHPGIPMPIVICMGEKP